MNRFRAALPKRIDWRKRIGKALAPTVFAVGIAAGVGLYSGVDGFYVKVTAAPTPPPISSESVCATGSLQLTGSTAFMPIAQEAADAYMHYCPGASITVTGGDSAYGLTKVQDAVASGSSSAGSIIAMHDGSSTDTAGLRAYPMGVLIFSVVAHIGFFPAGNITTSELRKIFVKPGEQGLVAVGRRAGDGSRRAFITNVLGINPNSLVPDKGNCQVPAGSRVSFTSCTEDSTADLLNFVNGTPNAIGYAEVFGPLGYPHISVLSIDNVAPTRENVLNGLYKFWTRRASICGYTSGAADQGLSWFPAALYRVESAA